MAWQPCERKQQEEMASWQENSGYVASSLHQRLASLKWHRLKRWRKPKAKPLAIVSENETRCNETKNMKKKKNKRNK